MNTVQCTALLAVTLIVVPTGRCLAGGMYQLQGYPTFGGSINYANGETIVFEPNPAPVYAKLKLSGDSPYYHTDIVSLTFTPAGTDLIGYAGEYTGIFDSSSGSIAEDSDGRLVSSGNVSGSPILIDSRTKFIDTDAPSLNSAETLVGIVSRLELSFFAGSSVYVRQSQTIAIGNSTFLMPHNSARISGSWIKAIPEPTTFVLVLCGVHLLHLAIRYREAPFGDNLPK